MLPLLDKLSSTNLIKIKAVSSSPDGHFSFFNFELNESYSPY